MSNYWRHLCLCAALLGAVPLLAAEADPPGRVGRISLANEGVQLRIGDSVASGTAALNWPLTTGALIETTSEDRAEARIGSTTLRLDGGTSLQFVELSDERIWLRLNRGSVILVIRNAEHVAEMALDTPEGRLRFDAPGSYRADVAGGTTAFSAYAGAARVEDSGPAVRRGDRVLLLDGNQRKYILGQAANDDFRQWALVREQQDAQNASQYISPEMTGQEELERYGIWRETAEYGTAWFPQGMPPGWAPYRWGNWTWISPWGWTWIDQSPWGFAPFHYGRWMLIGGNWAWLPGTHTARPVYAPALVVWLGQPGWNVSFSFGAAPAVGWFPLGPKEAYYPHYRSSLRHVRNINAHHVPNADRIMSAVPPGGSHRHIHRDRHEAVTVVPEKAVQSGSPVNRFVAPQDKGVHWTAPARSAPPAFVEHKQFQAAPPSMPAPVRPAAEPLMSAPRSGPVPPRHDMPTSHKETIRRPASASAPAHMPQPPPAVIAPSPPKQMSGAESGRNEDSRVRRIQRGDKSGTTTGNAPGVHKSLKQAPHDR